MPKKFKKFIMDASRGSCKTVSQDRERLIRGFYCIISKKNYNDNELKTYLNDNGYDVTPKELKKIKNLHDATELLFKIHNMDY